MIALVILGLGLLFIAAALPAGLEYTRQTIDLATAEAAGDYALERIAATLHTSDDLYDHDLARTTPPVLARRDGIMRPRRYQPTPPPLPGKFPVNDLYEPFIKVRPLALGNLSYRMPAGAQSYEIVDDAEQAIMTYLLSQGVLPTNDPKEYDISRLAATGLSLAENPLLPGVARVYPPVEPVVPYVVGDLMNNRFPYLRYATRTGDNRFLFKLRSEQKRAFDRRISWTAFYRRVSYEFRDEDSTFGNGNEFATDPYTYELIVVVTRRVSERHRFARQDVSAGGIELFSEPRAVAANYSDRSTTGVDGGADRILPMPWLVVCDPDPSVPFPYSPQLVRDTDYYWRRPYANNENYVERTLSVNFSPPPTISLVFKAAVRPLLSKGSVLIPAVNDQKYIPQPTGGPQVVGFVPSAPDGLPIYEVLDVVDGPNPEDQVTVVVSNNGYYPWLNPDAGVDAQKFPFWIIPPCFAERDGGQPRFENVSPVVRVFRRTIRISESN